MTAEQAGARLGSTAAAGVVTPAPADDGDGLSAGTGRVRKRAYRDEQRVHRLYPRFSDEELEVVMTGAALAGMTPAGYVARCALDVATERVRPAPVTVVDAMERLSAAQAQLSRYGGLVDQVVAKFHSSGEVPVQLLPLMGRTGQVVMRLDEAAGSVIAAFAGELSSRQKSRARAAHRRLAAAEVRRVGEDEAWDGVEVQP